MTTLRTLSLITILFAATSCMYRPISKKKEIVYDPSTGMKMDVYAPKKQGEAKEMLVFVHGGNWNAGKRETYRFFGRRMAKRGFVTAVIDYRTAYATGYEKMAQDVAKSAKYLKEHAEEFNGDSSKLFISGHSAGGHLAALVALNNRYFKELKMANPIKGVILIDAFGLDMYDYLSQKKFEYDSIYIPTFTKDPENWKDGSPIHFLHKGMPPILMFVGANTWSSISSDNYNFWSEAKEIQKGLKINTVKHRRHVAMITQFIWPWSKRATHTAAFIRDPKSTEEVDLKL